MNSASSAEYPIKRNLQHFLMHVKCAHYLLKTLKIEWTSYPGFEKIRHLVSSFRGGGSSLKDGHFSMPPRLSGDDASNFFAKITLGILGLLSRWEPWCIFQRVGGMWLEELSDFSRDPVSLATLKRSLRKEMGVPSAFRAAGFEEVACQKEGRPIMRYVIHSGA